MLCSLQIVKTRDFLKLNAQGRLDLKQSHDVLAGLAKAFNGYEEAIEWFSTGTPV